MYTSLSRYLSTTLSLLVALVFTVACASQTLPPKASKEELERGWKVTGSVLNQARISGGDGSFKSKLKVYLFKTMDKFYCQQVTKDGKSVGEKSYLKDGKRGIGWHTVPLRVKIIWKDSNNRTISWKSDCEGEIAKI